MLIFALFVILVFNFTFFLPVFNKIPYFGFLGEIDSYGYFLFFFLGTLIIIHIYLFFANRLYSKMTKFIFMKTYILLFLFILLFSFNLYFEQSWMEFKTIFLFKGILFLHIHYFLLVFIIKTSQQIIKKRQTLLFRRIAFDEEERKKLYYFINNFFIPLFPLMKFINFLEFINSYILEREDKIEACINIYKDQELSLVFYFISYNYETQILENLKSVWYESKYIIFINSINHFEREKVLDYFQRNGAFEISEFKDLKFYVPLQKTNLNYLLKDFYFLISEEEDKNFLCFRNNSLQRKESK